MKKPERRLFGEWLYVPKNGDVYVTCSRCGKEIFMVVAGGGPEKVKAFVERSDRAPNYCEQCGSFNGEKKPAEYVIIQTRFDGAELIMARRKTLDAAIELVDAYKNFDKASNVAGSYYRIQFVYNEENLDITKIMKGDID